MRGSKIVLGIIGLFLVGIIGWNFLKKDTQTGTMKIGGLLFLSGDFAFFGEAINQGAILAADEAKEKGIDVVYIPQDDQSTATGAANAANKLVNVDRVDAAITATVQEVKPVTGTFNGTSIPLIAVWDSNDFIKSAGPNIFTIGFSTEDAGEMMAQHAHGKLGLRKVAVVSQKDDWSSLIASSFAKKFTELGGAVALSEELQPSQKDFRTTLAKAKNLGVDGIYFPFLPGTIAPFAMQAKELGLNAALLSGDSFTADEGAQAKGAAEGTYFTNLYSDKSEALAKKYKDRYGKDVMDPVFLSFGYDGFNTALAAVQKARASAKTPVQMMSSLSVQGTDGMISFDGKNYAEKYERLYRFSGGKVEEVK